ncbi:MAG: VTT domain-containing protein [Pseudomonadota bacterium]
MLDVLTNLIEQTERLGGWGLWALGLLAFAGAIMFVPRTPTSLAAGLVFGFVSAPVVLAGATAGAIVTFWAVRHGLDGRVHAWLARRRSLQLLVNAIDKDHWWLLALLRFWGPVPASVQNCLFALSSIDLKRFAAISLIFGAPQACAYAYLGSLGHNMVQKGLSPMAALASALAAGACIVAAAAIVGMRIRAELAKTGPPPS